MTTLTCPICFGRGHTDDMSQRCGDCGGSGYRPGGGTERCRSCNGSGEPQYRRTLHCTNCNGTGAITSSPTRPGGGRGPSGHGKPKPPGPKTQSNRGVLFYLRFVVFAIVAQFLVTRLPLYAELDEAVLWGIAVAIGVIAAVKVRISLLMIGAVIAFWYLENQ